MGSTKKKPKKKRKVKEKSTKSTGNPRKSSGNRSGHT